MLCPTNLGEKLTQTISEVHLGGEGIGGRLRHPQLPRRISRQIFTRRARGKSTLDGNPIMAHLPTHLLYLGCSRHLWNRGRARAGSFHPRNVRSLGQLVGMSRIY